MNSHRRFLDPVEVSGLMSKGILYIVATPLGNLGDMTPRAIETLTQVQVIAAEDTRHSLPLLRHFGIVTPCIALHDHNERERSAELITRLQAGENIALISDAGTPLISDPGYHLVRTAREHGLRIVPVPGPSALIAALSVCGLPTDRFVFEGFLSAKTAARRQRLEGLRIDSRTMVFFESGHRVVDSLQDMAEIMGPERRAVVARELTKVFETIHGDTLGALCQWVQADLHQQKGEFVVLVQGVAHAENAETDVEAERIVRLLLNELPVKRATALAAKITGHKKNFLYSMALKIVDDG